MKNYVIIGGGVASVACVEGIRSVDGSGKITLVCGEERPAYCRPLISYYLQGKTDFERMKYRPESFYKENGVELVFGKAAAINKDNKSVTVGNNTLPYDKLLVATGSTPFVPNFKGLDTVERKFSFMTEADAEAIDKAVTPASRVFIVGAGLIGLKCAEGLCGRVKEITVCDLSDRVLSSILDETCAKMMQNKLEENGIKFILGDSVSEFKNSAAVTSGGKTVEFDVLVLAVGVRPETSLVKNAGGTVFKGICVDERMQTSIADVYAAGDCAEGYDASAETNRVLAIWANAYLQGFCAGVNMAGGKEIFDKGIPLNAIGFFGYHALTAGSYDGEVFEEKTENSLKRLFVKDGLLKGFMLVGDVERAGIYTSLIREKTPLKTVDFTLLKLSPSLAAFGSEIRRKKLGGMV